MTFSERVVVYRVERGLFKEGVWCNRTQCTCCLGATARYGGGERARERERESARKKKREGARERESGREREREREIEKEGERERVGVWPAARDVIGPRDFPAFFCHLVVFGAVIVFQSYRCTLSLLFFFNNHCLPGDRDFSWLSKRRFLNPTP